MANENEVYYAADRPYGLIEGTVLADERTGRRDRLVLNTPTPGEDT